MLFAPSPLRCFAVSIFPLRVARQPAPHPPSRTAHGHPHTRSPRHPQSRQRQSARDFRPRRTPALRRDGSHLGVRLHPAQRHPAQRRSAHTALGFLVWKNEVRRKPPRRRGLRRFPRRAEALRAAAPRPLDDRAKSEAAPSRMRRARLPHRLRLEGLPAHRRGLRHRATRRSAAGGKIATDHLHSRDEGCDWPRRKYRVGRMRAALRGERRHAGPRPRHPHLRGRPRARRRTRDHSCRHQIRVRHPRWPRDLDR